MAENVKVIVRCRPMNSKEKELNSECVVRMKDCMVEIYDPNEGPAFTKQFTFDSVYDQNSVTENIYNDICYPLIESVLEGYNSTIFVYGQTGCGKSFSMEGNKSAVPPEKGIISRAFEHIFEAISVATETKYLALVSYLEIYNEQIRDLLLSSEKVGLNNNLNLKEVPNEGVTVPGLTQQPVHNVLECENLLNVGSKNRMIGATLMNQNSSRSHSIFTISIEQLSNVNNNETIRKGKLNLVDLAGSERQAKTGATGDRLKEATKINLSLSALGNVISALVDGKAKHIPYRDSKLTRLLQDSLGGNTRTLMIACVGPASRNYPETLSTLRYANRAKNIHNKPRVNEDPKDTMLRQYQEEIDKLKKILETRQATPLKIEDLLNTPEKTNTFENPPIPINGEISAKRDQLIQQYENEMENLKSLHENEKTQKENILKQIEIIKEEYQRSIERMNQEVSKKEEVKVSKEEILNRIEVLKANMIGGEKADDQEISERRKRKKLASERRLSAIAHVLAKIDMNEDREILQNQYKDISQELNLKTEALRKYRHKVKLLDKEISDIQGEFETERQDYLETIRKQEMNIKLLNQICEKVAGTLKKECNYRDLDYIKEQAIWSDDAQKYRLPELVIHRTKLPPAGRFHDNVQTAPARLDSSKSDRENGNILEKCVMHAFFACFTLKGQNHNRGSSSNSDKSQNSSEPTSPPNYNIVKLDKSIGEDIIGNYFKPRRATELLRQSLRVDTNQVFNTWRDGNIPFLEYTKNKPKSSETEYIRHGSPRKNRNGYLISSSSETNLKKPYKLEALPSIEKGRRGRIGALDLL